jgi:magnesium transporter
MDIFLISETLVSVTTEVPDAVPAQGFLWIDATHDEVAAEPEAWRDAIERATGTQIYDPHLTDVINLHHPSYFDATQDYEMVVFRKLALAAGANDAEKSADANGAKRKLPPVLGKLATKPVSFLLTDHALITIHGAHSRTIDATRNRLLDYRFKVEGGMHSSRLPVTPEELMLRLLNAMVDQYLDLRQPLTTQLDRWQRALLNPRRPFNDWSALLDARIELHMLDHLCEEQHDALQELRDHLIDRHGDSGNSRAQDLLLVRINDVIEHITRVLNHVRRLESSEIMRTLTVITALFMPLTLVTGIFGMNFVEMPLLKHPMGFWISTGLMAVIVAGLLLFFQRRRYLEDQVPDGPR